MNHRSGTVGTKRLGQRLLAGVATVEQAAIDENAGTVISAAKLQLVAGAGDAGGSTVVV